MLMLYHNERIRVTTPSREAGDISWENIMEFSVDVGRIGSPGEASQK